MQSGALTFGFRCTAQMLQAASDPFSTAVLQSKEDVNIQLREFLGVTFVGSDFSLTQSFPRFLVLPAPLPSKQITRWACDMRVLRWCARVCVCVCGWVVGEGARWRWPTAAWLGSLTWCLARQHQLPLSERSWKQGARGEVSL